MLHIGEFNQLTLLRQESKSLILDGGEYGEIFLPSRCLKVDSLKSVKEGQLLNVFIYRDSKNRLVATQEIPKAQVGQIVYLKAADVNKTGAFLDWGLSKDLLVPFYEQLQPMQKDYSYLVMVFLDDEKRIAASAKLDEFLEDFNESFEEGQSVDLVIADRTELGVKVVVNNTHWGILYQNEIFQRLKKGQKVSGYIKKIREDGRLDLSLQKTGYNKSGMDDLAAVVLAKIEQEGGYLAINDRSPPAEIAAVFSVSKKQFKQAVGKLYKQRLITIEDKGVRKV